MKGCMRAMVAQLKSDSEDLQQVGHSLGENYKIIVACSAIEKRKINME